MLKEYCRASFVGGIALVAIIATGDYFIGEELSLAPLYLIPIMLITWKTSATIGIAVSMPEAKDAGRWLFHGWHVTVAYVLGFFALLWILGWQPHPKHKATAVAPVVTAPALDVEFTAPVRLRGVSLL